MPPPQQGGYGQLLPAAGGLCHNNNERQAVAGAIGACHPNLTGSNNNMDNIIRNYMDTAEKPRSVDQIKAIARMIERHVSSMAAASFMALALAANSATPSAPSGGDLNLCAAVLVLEAQGEGRLGMELVWQVVWQRASSKRWKATPAGVCRQPLQFSCLNGVSEAQAIARAKRSSMWDQAVAIASSPPKYGKVNAKGCDHYHASYIRKPSWAKGERPRLTYKKHIFYKLED